MFRVLLLSSVFIGSAAMASGLEKAIPWGGETSGVAGIGNPYMQGSQALYFNPAGLVSDKAGAQDVTFNISPTMPTFKAPVDAAGDTMNSKSETLYPMSLMYGMTVNDKIGFGVGYYVSGGSVADFQNITFSPSSIPLESEVSLLTTELSAGVGYKVMDNLKIGVAYRIVTVQAGLDVLFNNAQGGATQVAIQGAKDTEYTGYRIGAQYKVNENFNLGLTYRSEVIFKANGNMSTSSYGPTGLAQLQNTTATVGSELPAAINLGGDYKITETWRVLAEYVWTQYSKVTNLAINPSGSAAIPLQLQFSDENQIRVAGEYTGFGMPIRFGYIYTSSVTNSNYMLPGLTPPGAANTVTLGTGYSFGSIRVDGGLEDTMMSGSSNNNSLYYRSGTYNLNLYALHLGATYAF